jgi:hypothetical protein
MFLGGEEALLAFTIIAWYRRRFPYRGACAPPGWMRRKITSMIRDQVKITIGDRFKMSPLGAARCPRLADRGSDRWRRPISMHRPRHFRWLQVANGVAPRVNADLPGAYYTIEVDGKPTIVFHAEKFAHAREFT